MNKPDNNNPVAPILADMMNNIIENNKGVVPSICSVYGAGGIFGRAVCGW